MSTLVQEVNHRRAVEKTLYEHAESSSPVKERKPRKDVVLVEV